MHTNSLVSVPVPSVMQPSEPIKLRTLKPSGEELSNLQNAARAIKAGNALIAAGTKQVDAGKKAVAEYLRSREIDPDTLPIGAQILIAEAVLVSIASQNRFDAASFGVAHPGLFAEFIKPLPVRHHKALC